jgi:hypothetical protein
MENDSGKKRKKKEIIRKIWKCFKPGHIKQAQMKNENTKER